MKKQEAAKQLVMLYSEAKHNGVWENENREYAEAVAIAVGELSKDGVVDD